eukprot:6190216-Pleurochrysis_carterae.AAC.2
MPRLFQRTFCPSTLSHGCDAPPALLPATQVLTYGKRTPPEELVEQIRAVSADDLTTLAKTMLKSPPTIAVYGDTTAVPRYDQVAAFFK